ncbi:hypothetical protein AX16_002840 [Volvariella volvacea WC 439]|nr:hypothetical protein AX16_002840 [Volvariella volvacea WC 439]
MTALEQSKSQHDAATTSGKSESLAELKGGKVAFKQKPTSFDKQSDTLQEIVNFREMIEQRIRDQEPPLIVFPDEHKPLIAKLAHESDKTLTALTKHIHHELLPLQDDEEVDGNSPASAILPFTIVENAIKEVMSRNNYGLDGIGGGKPPAAVCVWRWEVKSDHLDWLPKNARQKAETRMAERAQAKKELLAAFNSLSRQEQDMILDPKGNHKPQPKHGNKTEPTTVSGIVDLTMDEDAPGSAIKQTPTLNPSSAEDGNATADVAKAKPGRPKKLVDPEKAAEKAAKERERLEKKAAKAEKEKKEKDAQNKSRSIMASFFAKPKASSSSIKPALASTSDQHSEFEKIFKPFVLKKDTILAPDNWFVSRKKGKAATKGQCADVQMTDDLSTMTARDRLQGILSTLPQAANPRQSPRCVSNSNSLKTYVPVSVRNIMNQISEAEVAGDISAVRGLLRKLEDRNLFAPKVFIYHEDARPGYYGTWTRSSRVIGPRTPFVRDSLEFDYSYDSGAEWEEEENADADDVLDDDEEDVDEERDSDLDSWLVDDDDVEALEPYDIATPPMDLEVLSSPPPPPKRKSEENEKKNSKKRKVVVPLVPFSKGPCWESTVGQCDEIFSQYRIQLFNDTPYPINPFAFVSSCIEDARAAKHTTTAASDAVFAVPSLPDHVVNGTVPQAGLQTPKKATATAKSAFPEAHLQYLLSKITALQAPSLTFLVEALYQDLRVHKVKKNAIEAKVREVGERCKERKVWVIKPDIKISSQS